MRSKVTPAVQSFFLIILHLHNQSFVFTDLLPSALSRRRVYYQLTTAELRSAAIRHLPSACASGASRPRVLTIF